MGIALEDAKAFAGTLNRLIEIAGCLAEEAGVPGDHDPRLRRPMPNPAEGQPQPGIKGPISVAIAKDTLFVTTDTTLLEQVLRPGKRALADNAAVPDFAKEIPEGQRDDFRPPGRAGPGVLRAVKSGQFEKALHQARPDVPRRPGPAAVPKISTRTSCPSFSVLAKYLTLGGSYGVVRRRRLVSHRLHPRGSAARVP